MRLKNEIYKLLLSIFCCVSLSGFTTAAQQNHFQDEEYYRSGKKLTLSKTGVFENTDYELISLKSGVWRISNDTIHFSAVANVEDVELLEKTFSITYHSDNKLTLTGENGRFSYHDYASAFKQSGFPYSSLFRGALGMFFLFGVAYLLSRNRKGINWSLVVKGSILQLVLAVFILKVPFVSGIFDWLAKACLLYTSPSPRD